MPWLGDLVTMLETDGVATFGVDLFTSTKSAPPLLSSGTLTVIATGGTSADRTHNAVIRPATVRPGAQITARAANYTTAERLARLAYDAVVVVRNQWVNSGWYKDIVPLQEPFDGGLDARGQAQCQFNILGRVGTRLW
jgi:hypothetical protein